MHRGRGLPRISRKTFRRKTEHSIDLFPLTFLLLRTYKMIGAQVASMLALVTSLLKTSASISRIGALPALVSKVPTEALLAGHCLSTAGLSKTSSASLASYVQVRGEFAIYSFSFTREFHVPCSPLFRARRAPCRFTA